MRETFHWLDVQRIAEALADAHPGVEAYSIAFPDLRAMVEDLEGFEAQPGHPVNERILETIQQLWHDEAEDLRAEDDEE